MVSFTGISTDLDVLRSLEDCGILDTECDDNERYLSWRVNRPYDLPDWLKRVYRIHGEIRYYWSPKERNSK